MGLSSSLPGRCLKGVDWWAHRDGSLLRLIVFRYAPNRTPCLPKAAAQAGEPADYLSTIALAQVDEYSAVPSTNLSRRSPAFGTKTDEKRPVYRSPDAHQA